MFVVALFVNARNLKDVSELLTDTVTLLICEYQSNEVLTSFHKTKTRITSIGQPDKDDIETFLKNIDSQTI